MDSRSVIKCLKKRMIAKRWVLQKMLEKSFRKLLKKRFKNPIALIIALKFMI